MGVRSKAPEESDHDFFARLDSIVCGIRDRLHILPASVQLCGLYLGWAGHVARLPVQRQMSIVHCWRSLDRFRTSQLLGSSADGSDRRIWQVLADPLAGKISWRISSALIGQSCVMTGRPGHVSRPPLL
jgi:hypothetical protein